MGALLFLAGAAIGWLARGISDPPGSGARAATLSAPTQSVDPTPDAGVHRE